MVDRRLFWEKVMHEREDVANVLAKNIQCTHLQSFCASCSANWRWCKTYGVVRSCGGAQWGLSSREAYMAALGASIQETLRSRVTSLDDDKCHIAFSCPTAAGGLRTLTLSVMNGFRVNGLYYGWHDSSGALRAVTSAASRLGVLPTHVVLSASNKTAEMRELPLVLYRWIKYSADPPLSASGGELVVRCI